MLCSPELPREIVREVAAILARGYLNYRRSLILPILPPPEKALDTGADASAHVHAVNAAREGDD